METAEKKIITVSSVGEGFTSEDEGIVTLSSVVTGMPGPNEHREYYRLPYRSDAENAMFAAGLFVGIILSSIVGGILVIVL